MQFVILMIQVVSWTDQSPVLHEDFPSAKNFPNDLLKNNSPVNYLEKNYSDHRQINFRRIYNSIIQFDNRTEFCGAVLLNIFVEHNWIRLPCDKVLPYNVVLCETTFPPDTAKDGILYSLQSTYCTSTHTLIAGSCWRIIFSRKHQALPKYNLTITNLHFRLYQYLSSWAYGMRDRRKVALSRDLSGVYCITTSALVFQRISYWTLGSCTNTLEYRLLHHRVRSVSSNNNFLYTCSDGTQILLMYVCADVQHCLNKNNITDCQGELSSNDLKFTCFSGNDVQIVV